MQSQTIRFHSFALQNCQMNSWQRRKKRWWNTHKFHQKSINYHSIARWFKGLYRHSNTCIHSVSFIKKLNLQWPKFRRSFITWNNNKNNKDDDDEEGKRRICIPPRWSANWSEWVHKDHFWHQVRQFIDVAVVIFAWLKRSFLALYGSPAIRSNILRSSIVSSDN